MSSVLERLSSQREQVLAEIQKCLQALVDRLLAGKVIDERTVAEVTSILEELDDPEIAAETLYDSIFTRAQTDPNVLVRFLNAAGKVNPNIVDVLRSPTLVTWELLTEKRNEIVKIVDANVVIEASVKEGILTQQQYKALIRARERGTPQDVIAYRFLSVLEKLPEDQRTSKMAVFESVLLDKQPNVMTLLLETGKLTTPSCSGKTCSAVVSLNYYVFW